MHAAPAIGMGTKNERTNPNNKTEVSRTVPTPGRSDLKAMNWYIWERHDVFHQLPRPISPVHTHVPSLSSFSFDESKQIQRDDAEFL